MEYEIQIFGKSKLQMKIPKFYAGGFTGSGSTYGFYLIIEDVSDHYKILSNSQGSDGSVNQFLFFNLWNLTEKWVDRHFWAIFDDFSKFRNTSSFGVLHYENSSKN